MSNRKNLYKGIDFHEIFRHSTTSLNTKTYFTQLNPGSACHKECAMEIVEVITATSFHLATPNLPGTYQYCSHYKSLILDYLHNLGINLAVRSGKVDALR